MEITAYEALLKWKDETHRKPLVIKGARQVGKICYWTPDEGIAEIDFLIQISGNVIPVEVKAAENLKTKSLRSFHEKYHPRVSVRTSMSDYREEPTMINMPLYAVGLTI